MSNMFLNIDDERYNERKTCVFKVQNNLTKYFLEQMGKEKKRNPKNNLSNTSYLLTKFS